MTEPGSRRPARDFRQFLETIRSSTPMRLGESPAARANRVSSTRALAEKRAAEISSSTDLESKGLLRIVAGALDDGSYRTSDWVPESPAGVAGELIAYVETSAGIDLSDPNALYAAQGMIRCYLQDCYELDATGLVEWTAGGLRMGNMLSFESDESRSRFTDSVRHKRSIWGA